MTNFSENNSENENVLAINPTKLSESERELLGDFLDGDDDPEVFFKDKNYPFDESVIKLSKEISWRLSKDKESQCFEVIGKRVGNGNYGFIDKVKGKLFFKDAELVYMPVHQKPNKARIRKEIPRKKHVSENQWRRDVNKEYRRTKQAGHLFIRKPVFFQDDGNLRAYLFMRKMPGQTLEQVLKGDLDEKTRLAICLSILQAYTQQVKARNLVHNDISPRNIMVDLSDPHNPRCFFIDFAFAKKQTTNDAMKFPIKGTALYIAPERFEGKGSSTKSDVFSLGHILAQVMGEKPPSFNTAEPFYQRAMKGEFDSELIHLNNQQVKKQIQAMLNPNPGERALINEVSATISTALKEDGLDLQVAALTK
ncbi:MULTISPECIES: protein kinase domain-containing protein [Legionella]|uniref:Ser/Thr protein kinase n=1 Tax=Legionella drozanskii LLAP-1 TaxID=1212489 RepID=A0A0W0SMM8_9GAMM|nr:MULTISPECIES: protein kinase [Legionella]KTC84587.1 Ser/Thr protein kinase [Legionella drozanskii LLAP-1]PJE18336.1 MAG: serine/threonine protein kinase [Legionella sp.]